MSILGRHHGIITREAKRLPVALRRVAIQREMTLEHFVGLAVDHADQAIGFDRRPGGDGTHRICWLLVRSRGSRCLQGQEHNLMSELSASGATKLWLTCAATMSPVKAITLPVSTANAGS